MPVNDRTVWGIHAGATGDADALFMKHSCIAIGWMKVGNLSDLSPSRNSFRERFVQHYPESKAGAVPVKAGQIFRFVHEMQPGDYVVYPSKKDRQIHIGQISGAYAYNPSLEAGYPNQRSVIWLKSLPRTHFTQGALYEIGSAMSLFQVKNYAEEFLAALEGRTASNPVPVDKDETVALVAEDIEQTTRDFILKQLARELKGHPLADFVAHLLEKMGYKTRVSPPGPDGGIDVIAHKDDLGFEPPIIKTQVKSSEGAIGAPAVQALYGNIDSNNSEYGLFITLGTFTPPALTFARSKSNLRLIDGVDLVNLILQHYEKFDSRYKGLIPLKRVYVPEVLADEE